MAAQHTMAGVLVSCVVSLVVGLLLLFCVYGCPYNGAVMSSYLHLNLRGASLCAAS
jgi:hypothetical protein